MDKFPMLWDGRPVGELTLEKEPLYTWFTVQCRMPEEGLWCAWVTGDQGELRLGILEPDGGCFGIRRRYSIRLTAPLGRVLNGEVRLAFNEEAEWEQVLEPDRQICDPWLRKQIGGRRDVLMRFDAEHTYLAVPYDKEKPFPMLPLFCFAVIRVIQKQSYAVFAFDKKHRPVFV